MKIKLDENLPAALVEILTALKHDVDTVITEGLTGRSDADVWLAAQRARRFFVTQDLDFSDVRVFKPGTHVGLLLVRLREPSRRALLLRVRCIFETEAVDRWEGCVVIATERKLRVRRPSP